nr:hypothetical protein [Tanacetum cinerariifolium]
RIWEEFTQSIQSFIKDKKNLALHTQGKKKSNPLVIPSVSTSHKTCNHQGIQITSSQQPKPAPSAPKSAPAKPHEKKQRMVKETSDEPSPAKRSKPSLVIKKRKPTSSLRLVDDFIDEGVPENEPRFDDEEANLQRAVEESLKDVHATHQGPLPPVVFREPDSGRRQPLLEVQGKGKEKVIEEQDILEELASSTGTLSSLQHLTKDFSFGDQLFNDKPSEAENEKTTTKTKAESMVSITIQQDTSAIPPMTTPVINLTSDQILLMHIRHYQQMQPKLQ